MQKKTNPGEDFIQLKKGHILVIDDMATSRATIKLAVSQDGHTITEAATGDEALEKLEQGNFDCVMLDQVMPGLSGLDTIKKIREKYSSFILPVMFVTSVYDKDVIKTALAAGANDYVIKPFEYEILRVRINSQIIKKQLVEKVIELQQKK